MTVIQLDQDFVDTVIDAVRDCGDFWDITYDQCVCFGMKKQDTNITPAKGDKLRVYGAGLGCRVRGVFINGEKYFYKTTEEQKEEDEREAREYEAQLKAEYESKKDGIQAKIDALPEVFQNRIAKFRNNSPNFWKYEEYEVFVCEQALVFAKAFEPDSVDFVSLSAAIQAFRELSPADQRKVVPDMSDDHSNNTFIAAISYAYLYLTSQETLANKHAAFAPIAGCKECGCHTE